MKDKFDQIKQWVAKKKEDTINSSGISSYSDALTHVETEILRIESKDKNQKRAEPTFGDHIKNMLPLLELDKNHNPEEAAKIKAKLQQFLPQEETINSAEKIAKMFHESYEALSSYYGYTTRPETQVDWKDLPENNKNLMIATCERVMSSLHYYLMEKKDSVIPMPEGLVNYNASSTPCDMLVGPCSCGSWHTIKEWTITR